MGNPFGPPDTPDVQRRILAAALELAVAATEAGQIVDFDDHWPTDFTDKVRTSLLAM